MGAFCNPIAGVSSQTRRRQWHSTPVLWSGKSHGRRSLVGCSPWGRKESDMTERLPFHALEKEMATHSGVLAWRIPGMGEPGGQLSKGSHRVRHDWSDLAAAAASSCSGAIIEEEYPFSIGTFVEIKTQLYIIYVYNIYLFFLDS